uniref:Testis specific 10 n=1 Tax=Varanus komodoensis TaxID=61221 RepID=A0A8D2Q8S3_VARKO
MIVLLYFYLLFYGLCKLPRQPPANDDLRLVTRERDELQSMLDKFEKHMIEIQSNVKLLTAERDKLNILYEQSQDDLNRLRKETKTCLLTQSHAEEERNIALADFRRIVAEKEELREKLKVSHYSTVGCSYRWFKQASQTKLTFFHLFSDKFNSKNSTQDETISVLRSTINILDKEKDRLQECVDEKTERIAYLDDNLANKVCIQSFPNPPFASQLKDALSGKDRELASFRRQLDAIHSELGETSRVKEIALKENRRLQDDLTTMNDTHHNFHTKIFDTVIHCSVLGCFNLNQERENKELLEKFQMLHSQAEDWEVKAHQAEGQSSSVRLELLSVDTERRHLRERVELLEKEIQEHIIAHQAYESQISSMAKNMAKLEESLRQEKEEKSSVIVDVTSVREMCVKLESGKDLLSRQLTSKSLELERIMSELEEAKAEAELLKKQLSSERLTIQNLETLLATSRDKDFQNHLITHEKESEIQLLKDKLTLSESKLLNREVSILRNKLAQLQADYDIVKRQLTTERFERERAIQEMRRHGLSTTSLHASSPLSSTLRSPSHSPERALTERTDKYVIK